MSVPSIIRDRWRSRNLTGDAEHVCIVRVRRGHFERGYLSAGRLDHNYVVFPPLIWKGINHGCWKALWEVDDDWVTLPQIRSANFSKSFQNIGEVGGTGGSGSGQTSSVLTVTMDNIGFEPVTGAGGLYHEIRRGTFSPLRGTAVTTRPQLWASDEWTDALNGGYQIELWEGYGPPDDPTTTPLATPEPQTIDGRLIYSCSPTDPAIVRTWTGIVETCEMSAAPDIITITARDFGLTLTDQRCMGRNKALEIRAPIHFADKRQTEGQIIIEGNYRTSSGLVNTDGDWQTTGKTSSADFEWIELALPAGYYEDFLWAPRYDGQEVSMSLHMGPGGGFRRTGVPFPAGWVDIGAGSLDGIPYLRHWNDMPKVARRWSFDQHSVDGYHVPDGSKMRLTFTKLTRDKSVSTAGEFFTGGQAFKAYKFGTDPSKPPGLEINATHWILVEDATDVIRMVLIWCGFREWRVESMGWSLAHPLVYGESTFFQDIINDILAQGNYMFWMGAPTADDQSIGVPIFQHQTATDVPPRNMVEVRDTDLLESADFTFDASDLPYVMRVRGDLNKKGQTLDQDTQKRYMATYYPPWSGRRYATLGDRLLRRTPPDRVAGILRHFTQTLGASSTIGLYSNDECLFGCVLAAIQYCLQMLTGTFQIAGLPGFELNEQCSVVDEGTGFNSRVWIASIQSNHTLGPRGSWHMTLGGAAIDTEDMSHIAADYIYAWWKQHGRKPLVGENTTPPGGFADAGQFAPTARAELGVS